MAPALLGSDRMQESGSAKGRLVCVGLGMMLGAHLGPRARHAIETADVVFVVASDALVEAWVRELRPDVRSLQVFYGCGKSRRDTYREMVGALLSEVRAGHRVCGAFYGHPGVFARVAHDAIADARAEGFEALMDAAVSAEDCLYADMGIDPGRVGCQHYEANQLVFYRRRVDPSAFLVLWQAGVVGDRTLARFETGPAHRQLLVDRLLELYDAAHPVVLYEAATLPIQTPRMETVALGALASADIRMHTTLVIAPAAPLVPDEAMFERLAAIEASLPLPSTSS